MDWTDRTQARAYKAGYMRGQRLYKYLPKGGASELAIQVMLNEIERARKISTLEQRMALKRKTLRTEGNAEWERLKA